MSGARRGAGLLTVCALLGALGAAPHSARAEDGDGTVPTSTAAAAEAAERARLEAVAAELDRVASGEPAPPSLDTAGPSTGFVGKLIQTAITLIAVCALAYLVLGKLMPALLSMSPTARRAMRAQPSRGEIQVIDRLPLDPKKTLYVVQAGTARLLIGATDQQLSLLGRLDDAGSEPERPEEG